MRNEVIVDIGATKKEYGCYPNDLTIGSSKSVIVVCTFCKKTIVRPYRDSHNKHINSFKGTLSVDEFKNNILNIEWWFNAEG